MADRETLAQEQELVDNIRLTAYRKEINDPNFVWKVNTNVSEAEERTLREYFQYHSRRTLFGRTKYGATHALPQAGEEIARKIVANSIHAPAIYIGEHPLKFALRYQPGDHLELPIVDYRDARHNVRMAQLKEAAEKRGAEAKLKVVYDAIVRALASPDHSGDSAIVCTRMFGTGCKHKAKLAVAFMSLHDFDPALLPAAMEAQGIERLISAKFIPSQISVRDNWEQPGEYWFRESREGLLEKECPTHFYLGFYSGNKLDTQEPYRHSYNTVRKWYTFPGFSNGMQSVSVEMSSYGPFRIFDCELAIAGGTSMRVSPTGLEDYVQVVKGRNFVAKGGDPTRLVPNDYRLIPKHVFDQVMIYLESKSEGSRVLTAQVMRSKTISLKFDGKVLEKGYEVDYDTFRDLATTVHLLSMLNKRDEIHLCEAIKRTHDRHTNRGVIDWALSKIKSWTVLPDTERQAAADTLYKKIRPAQFQEHVITSKYGSAPLQLPHAALAEEAEALEECGIDPLSEQPPVAQRVIPAAESEEYASRMCARIQNIVQICEDHGFEGVTGQTLRTVVSRAATVASLVPKVDLDLNKVHFITGPAGSGKSTLALKNAPPRTVVVVHSRVLAKQWRLKTSFQIYTKHRFLNACGSRNFSHIIVDEASRWSVHDIALFQSLLPAATITVVGDMRQIGHIDYEGLYEQRVGEGELPRHSESRMSDCVDFMPTTTLTVNHRNPLGTVIETARWLDADFTSPKTEDQPWVKAATIQSAIREYTDAVIMCFGRVMRDMLRATYPDRVVETVDAMMGTEVNTVILVVDEDSYPIQALQSKEHVYVSVTRMSGTLVVTEADAEKLSKIMETAKEAFLNHSNTFHTDATLPLDLLRADKLRRARVTAELDDMPADTRMCDQIALEAIFQKHLPSQHDPTAVRAITYDHLPPMDRPCTIIAGGFTMDYEKVVPVRVLEHVSPRGKSTFGVKESVAATFIGRFGRKKPKLIYSNPRQVEAKAKSLVAQMRAFAFRKDWKIDKDFIQRQVLKNVLNMYEKKTIKDVQVLEGLRYLVHLSGEQKKQHKVSASKDMALANKNGQTIISIGKDAVNEFGPMAAGITELVHGWLKPQFRLHDSAPIQESAGHLCAHVGNAVWYGSDLTEQDGSWNEMWNHFKRTVGVEMMMQMSEESRMKLKRITQELFDKEFNRMINWDVLCRDAFRAAFEFMNHSGNSFTLFFNSMMSLAIIPEVFDFEGREPLGLVFVGDDTLWCTAKGVGKWRKKELAMAEWTLGVRIKQEAQTVPTICKHFVTSTGVYPNVMKMAMSTSMRPYKDAKDLQEYQTSLKNDLELSLKTEAQLKTAASATATAHPAVTIEDARALCGFLKAFAEWDWDHFVTQSVEIKMVSKRVISTSEAAAELRKQWKAAAGTKFQENPLLQRPLTTDEIASFKPKCDFDLALLNASRQRLNQETLDEGPYSKPIDLGPRHLLGSRPDGTQPHVRNNPGPRPANPRVPVRPAPAPPNGGNANPTRRDPVTGLPTRTIVPQQVVAFEPILARVLDDIAAGGPQRPDGIDHEPGRACDAACHRGIVEPEDRQAVVPLAGRQLPLVAGPEAFEGDAANPPEVLGLIPIEQPRALIPVANAAGRRRAGPEFGPEPYPGPGPDGGPPDAPAQQPAVAAAGPAAGPAPDVPGGPPAPIPWAWAPALPVPARHPFGERAVPAMQHGRAEDRIPFAPRHFGRNLGRAGPAWLGPMRGGRFRH